MSITNSLWQHRDFRGDVFTRNSGNSRYYGTRWYAHNDMFSSVRAWALTSRGNVFAFEHAEYNGRFAALNLQSPGSSSWWYYFGDDFNDRVSSSLIVAREAADREQELELGALALNQFRTLFDATTQGTQLSRRGEPTIRATYFPSWDPGGVYATIGQDLRVALDWWPDYDARVEYSIKFRLVDGRLDAYAANSYVWVEGGVFSGRVHDGIAPRLHGAKSQITQALRSTLRLFEQRRFADVYLLPGKRPNMGTWGYKGTDTDDVTLVLVAT